MSCRKGQRWDHPNNLSSFVNRCYSSLNESLFWLFSESKPTFNCFTYDTDVGLELW